MFVMEANAGYRPDDEITISYGDHRSMFNFFVYSGFTPRGQTYGDFIAVKVVDAYGHHDASAWGCIGVDGRPQRTWLHMIASRASNTGGMEHVAKVLLDAARAHVATWPTGYNEDMKELAAEGSYGYKWAALSYRTRFKSIYNRLDANVVSALAANDWTKPKYSTPEDRNNECYHHRRHFTNFDYAMDHVEIVVKRRCETVPCGA